MSYGVRAERAGEGSQDQARSLAAGSVLLYPCCMIFLVAFTPAVDECVELPHLKPGTHYRGRLLGRQASGKGVNVARTLGHLGVPSTLAGFVGAGEADYFRLSFAGLPVTFELIAVPAVTRRAAVSQLPACSFIDGAGYSCTADSRRLESASVSLCPFPGARKTP